MDMTFDEMKFNGYCDVCGTKGEVATFASGYGPLSLSYCKQCIIDELEPYYVVVAYIAGGGHFPYEIKECYVEDVRRMLPLWGKAEEEFIRDVDKMIADFEKI